MYRTFCLILFAWFTSHALAEDVTLKLPSGLTALATYEPGEADKPVVLLLHGFLQTSGFSTVARLAEALEFSGYAVLRPNLSLGVDRRKSSVSCKAIHTHGMDDAVAEIGAWLDWLARQGHAKTVLLGHSFGSLQLLAYQSQRQDPRVAALILTSLIYIGQEIESPKLAMLTQKAEQARRQGNPMPDEYALSFCPRYTTLAEPFLSYLAWGKQPTATAIQSLKDPIFIIIGDQDNRIDQEWLALLNAGEITLKTIVGANHFFDSEHELELQQTVEVILENIPR